MKTYKEKCFAIDVKNQKYPIRYDNSPSQLEKFKLFVRGGIEEKFEKFGLTFERNKNQNWFMTNQLTSFTDEDECNQVSSALERLFTVFNQIDIA